jgi:hypothetical protein
MVVIPNHFPEYRQLFARGHDKQSWLAGEI